MSLIKKIGGLLCALTLAVGLRATTVTGKFVTPALQPANGTAYFTLIVPGNRAPLQQSIQQVVVPMTVPVTLDNTGSIPSPGINLVGNDDLSPTDTYYQVQIRDPNGNLLGTQMIYITGATTDLGTAVYVSPLPTVPTFTNVLTGGGTATSVGLNAPSGFSVTNSPITTSGTITLNYAVPADSYLLTSTGANAAAWKQINGGASCGDTTHAVGYDASTQQFNCQTISAPGTGTVTNVGTGDLPPLFTSSITNPTTTPSLAFTLSNAAGYSWFGNAAGTTGAPSYNTSAIPTQMLPFTYSGTGTELATFTGVATAGRCIDTDASGNLQVTASDCGTPGVTSVTGDGSLITNNLATGAVTLTTGTAAAYSFWGNNTSGTAAAGFHQLGFSMLSGLLGDSQLPADAVKYTGAIVPGNCVTWSSAGVAADAGFPCPTGGSGTANQQVSFSNSTSATLTATAATSNLVWACWDNNSPANAIYPSNVSLNPSTYLVTFTFTVSQSGYCVVNGTGGSGGTGNSTITIANASSTGTTANTLTKVTGAPSTAVIAATTDTGGVIGVTTAGAGTAGNATVQLHGSVSCVFDGATTAGDYVQISGTTAGNCHDTGATYPTTGQTVGRVLSTNVGGGTYTMLLFPAEIKGGTGGGGGTTVTVGGASLASSTANFSNTTPAAEANYALAKVQADSGTPTNLSIETAQPIGQSQVLAGPIAIPGSSIQVKVVTPNQEACASSGDDGGAPTVAIKNCQIAQAVNVGDRYEIFYHIDRPQTSGGNVTCTLTDTLGNTINPVGPAGGVHFGQVYEMVATVAGTSDTILPDQTTCTPTGGHQYNETMLIVQVFNSAGVDQVVVTSDPSCPGTGTAIGQCSAAVTTTYPYEPILTFLAGGNNALIGGSYTSISAVNAISLSRGLGNLPSYLMEAQGVPTPGSTTVLADISGNAGENGFIPVSFLPQQLIPTPTIVQNGGSSITYPASLGTLTAGHTYILEAYNNNGGLTNTGCSFTDTLSNTWTWTPGYNGYDSGAFEIFLTTSAAGGADAISSSNCTLTYMALIDISNTGGYETYVQAVNNGTPTLTVSTQAENDIVMGTGAGACTSTTWAPTPNLQVLASHAGSKMDYFLGTETVGRPGQYPVQLNNVASTGCTNNPMWVTFALRSPATKVLLTPRKLVDTERGVAGQTVTAAATIDLDAFDGRRSFYIPLTQNTTIGYFQNFDDGQIYHFDFCEDGTGGRTITFPSNVNYSPVINTAASTCTALSAVWDGKTSGGGTLRFFTNQGQLNASQIANAFDKTTNNNIGLQYVDVGKISAPANPATGYDRWYADTTSGNMACLTSTGGSCLPTPTGTNATQLQSINVCSGTPSDTNVLAYSATNSCWQPSAAAAAGMVKIAQTIVTTPVATITFSSIPGTYTHLKLIVNARYTDAATSEGMTVIFNGDAGANYDYTWSGANNASAQAATSMAQTNITGFITPANTATASNSSGYTIDIDNYATTAFFKNLQGFGGSTLTNGTNTTYYERNVRGQWRSTAAITSITLGDGGGGNFQTGSVASLYGIP